MSSVESNPQPEVQKLAEKRVRFVRLPELAMLNHKDTASAAKGPGGGHGGEASAGASEWGVEANREPEGEGEAQAQPAPMLARLRLASRQVKLLHR